MGSMYYKAALSTLNKLEKENSIDSNIIKEIWSNELLKLGSKDPKKGCPKNAITSIILNGHIKFKSEKIIKRSHKKSKEYTYCCAALEILQRNKDITFSATKLWSEVEQSLGIKRSSQGEMYIVLAFWENNLIRL